MRSWFSLLVPFALTLAGCGGTDEGRLRLERPETSAVDRCRADQGYELLTMLDFEPTAGARLLDDCDPEFVTGCSFYFNYDTDTSPANPDQFLEEPGDGCVRLAVAEDAVVSTSPELGDSNLEPAPIEAERCGADGHALNIVTQNVGMCYGTDGRLGWGAALDVTFGPVLDASDWDGISFWVRQGAAGEKPAIIVQFVDPNTSGALTDPETNEPVCDATDSDPGQVPDSKKCDSFGTAVTLTDEWTFVPIRFDTLHQKGFGVVSPAGRLLTEEIVRMQIFMNAGDADFWMDDIALFRGPE